MSCFCAFLTFELKVMKNNFVLLLSVEKKNILNLQNFIFIYFSLKAKVMQIVTLTTDWGERDFYCGLVKSLLYNTISDVNVVDVTHGLKKFDILSASFVVKNACLAYPENTIHIIDVNTFESANSSFLVVKANGQYYICTDNGLPSLVFENTEVEIYDTSRVFSESNFYTFAVWDNFCKIAKIISQTHSMETIGLRKEAFEVKKISSLAFVDKDFISSTIIYIDDYGNAYLNIDNEEFVNILAERRFEIRIGNKYIINKISQSYQDVHSKGDALLTVSVTGQLELALREGNFAKLLDYKVGDAVEISIL